ncbi:FadD3 family acyl-CoA ligase [Undibacterium arcticum]|uniref:FadD3 family acyl-CoA ligase n=1 Tax=Undibacterium arcticum TaxID=1762892 RepID=A0ABV7EXE5_9BURK
MLPSIPTIPRLISAVAQRYADRVAIEDGPTRLTYLALDALRLEAARALMSMGVEPANRVAIWAPNCWEWIVAALAAHSVGATLVPINTRMKGAEVADILARSGSRVLFCIGDFLGVHYPDMLAARLPSCVERVVVLRGAHPDECSWEAFVAEAARTPPEEAKQRALAVMPQHLSDLMFTSGTTGRPKGVMTTHGQNLRLFAAWSEVVGLRTGDRYLIVNPFFHAFGYKAGWLAGLMCGATIHPEQIFDVEAVMNRIARDRITFLPGPPTLYLSMLAHPRRSTIDLSSLRVAVTGAAAIAPALVKRMRDELGFRVVTTAYGLTECCGVATVCSPDDDAETIARTAGWALPGIEVRCADASGLAVPPGTPGEVWIRGFNVMRGYFDDPAATREAIDGDGWLHTGDIGELDRRGYLRITDRLKDMFIVGGFNCYPAEIERLLCEHPAVAQVAVVGMPEERLGEVGKAWVVLKEGVELDEQELIRWSREHMANYKVPRSVEFVQALPVNASGKVVKNALRARGG